MAEPKKGKPKKRTCQVPYRDLMRGENWSRVFDTKEGERKFRNNPRGEDLSIAILLSIKDFLEEISNEVQRIRRQI